MEEEREEQERSTESGTTSTQADTLSQICSEESNTSQNLQEPEEEDQVDSDVESSQVGKDLSIGDTETLPKQTLIPANTQDKADCLPLSPMPTKVTPTSVSSHPSNTQNQMSKPCWYCLRSLDAEYQPETLKQEDSDSLATEPSSGQKVNYQTDPRPHFGVAWSSHSTCRPLWGSEGPCWGQRNQEEPDQTHTCPHCHLGMTPDTLRWHEAKCLLFDGQKNLKK